MRTRALLSLLLVAGCAAGFLFWERTPVRPGHPGHWDATKAAAYLDSREVWWQSWAPAQQDKGTVCISCHTVLPYAMSRPALQPAAGAPEKAMIGSVEKRVLSWAQMAPYYSDRVGPGKAAQSRATEAVLNTVILASYDAREGHLRPITRTAFDETWALQEATGGWKWQDFHLAPWESAESAYQGAALLAVKTENAPDGYATESGTLSHVNRLWEYLQAGYSSQSVMNQLYVLWASAKSPRPLSSDQRRALLEELKSLQHRDGGWDLASLGTAPNLNPWQRVRRQIKLAMRPQQSDGCATGLVVVVLEQSGVSRQDATLSRGFEWLERNQNPDGSWTAESLNKKRSPQSDAALFMSDAATGYAVLALEGSK